MEAQKHPKNSINISFKLESGDILRDNLLCFFAGTVFMTSVSGVVLFFSLVEIDLWGLQSQGLCNYSMFWHQICKVDFKNILKLTY